MSERSKIVRVRAYHPGSFSSITKPGAAQGQTKLITFLIRTCDTLFASIRQSVCEALDKHHAFCLLNLQNRLGKCEQNGSVSEDLTKLDKPKFDWQTAAERC